MIARMLKTSRASAFVAHDFGLFEATNVAHFVALRASRGASAIVAVGDALRRQVAHARPGWPSGSERAADHAAHLRLIEILDRVPARQSE